MKKIMQNMNSTVRLSIRLLLGYLFLIALAILGFSSCTDQCESEKTYHYFEPIFTSMEEIRASVFVTTPTEIKQVGKIYFSNDYLFVNEPNEGVHVINNSHPEQPVNVAFINIPGAFDLAVKGNILFSDSYMDLVAIDISDLQNLKEIGRLENVYDEYNSYGFYASSEQGVVTGWEEKSTVTVSSTECGINENDWGFYVQEGIAVADAARFNSNQAVAPTNPGMGGSMARFAIEDNYLYSVGFSTLRPINISNPTNMITGDVLTIDWGLETIFPYNNHLFLGADDGMHIVDISQPNAPVLLSTYEHIRSCDPVVVQDTLAFVTLRSGSECQGFTNQLEVINIADLEAPKLLYTYQMFNPHGLGKDGDALFICDGSAGLKIYNANDISLIDQNLVAHYPNIQAFDIIPYNNVAMMIGEDGLFQYDYSDLNDIKLLSKIEFSHE